MTAEFRKEKIREIRDAKGWTQVALAQAVEQAIGRRVESREICRWETGLTVPSSVCLFGLCAASKRPIEFFFAAPVGAKLKQAATRSRKSAA